MMIWIFFTFSISFLLFLFIFWFIFFVLLYFIPSSSVLYIGACHRPPWRYFWYVLLRARWLYSLDECLWEQLNPRLDRWIHTPLEIASETAITRKFSFNDLSKHFCLPSVFPPLVQLLFVHLRAPVLVSHSAFFFFFFLPFFSLLLGPFLVYSDRTAPFGVEFCQSTSWFLAGVGFCSHKTRTPADHRTQAPPSTGPISTSLVDLVPGFFFSGVFITQFVLFPGIWASCGELRRALIYP